ncbi:hypothetical protein ASG19_07820 [Rhizobium sp. Leaf306]|uniref:hypothetical protein n=1 Tax=Rhizobium sp. Leaf306 TaxID=1736330 RepID=UPI00071315DC|nr:hypothetical protein [Rhizobium sp. Leaf306]KQQ36347.1 hypothetical protein ASG19_07820 [Rhizobium sp. Leaf306]
MDDNKNAQEAVEETGKKAPATSDSPVAGPHAKPELMDESKTPGTGSLPDTDDESVSPGGG